MSHAAEREKRDAQVEELKRLLSAKKHENPEVLEAAVDDLLWGELDRRQQLDEASLRELVRTHPK